MNTNSEKGLDGSEVGFRHCDGSNLERLCKPHHEAITFAPEESGIERIEARFSGNVFSPHRHDTYALGLTLSGIQTFSYRGAARFSKPGRLIVLHPDELHDGGAGTEDGLTYRMLYISPEKIRAALEGLGNAASSALPFVTAPVVDDAPLRASLVEALAELEIEMGALKRDGLIADIANHLARLSDNRRSIAKEPVNREAMMACREYLYGCAEENIRSEFLETMTGLDRFSLSRQFRAAFGTSPHRYLVQRRLERAKRLISKGTSLAGAAAETGFSDQSHMTRHFRKAYGITPGRWQTLAAKG